MNLIISFCKPCATPDVCLRDTEIQIIVDSEDFASTRVTLADLGEQITIELLRRGWTRKSGDEWYCPRHPAN